jgi:hypothetical protein
MNPHYVTFEQAKLLKEKGLVAKSDKYWVRMTKDDYREMYDYQLEDLDYSIGIGGNLVITKYQQWQVVEWLRQKGIIIELIVDGWGDDNCVNEEYLCYRIFIWQIGKPKPHHNDDLGALATPQEAYSDAFDYILNIKNRFFAKSTEK